MNRTSTSFRTLALGLALFLTSIASPAPAQERAKEPTDGFFDIPARPPGEEAEPWGLPAYLVISAIGGLGVFIMCKSARRG